MESYTFSSSICQRDYCLHFNLKFKSCDKDQKNFYSHMLTTRKQRVAKARRSREADLVSDNENMDMLMGKSHFDGRENETAMENRNSEVRDGCSNGNENQI